ncbi:MAG: hypothetical protein JWP61_788 [Friedmanniella sp.]|nr:hypothetical protein [Friedmanniella sp.]
MVVVERIRRYPVKSMGGEELATVRFNQRGMVGDRWYAVEDAAGLFASGKSTRRFRRRDAVFDYSASTTASGVTVSGVDGSWVVGDPALEEHLSERMAAPVRVLPEHQTPHQDMGAVSLVGTASLDWCAARWNLNADPRRLRVNLVVRTDEPFVEESWVGCRVVVGSVELLVRERIPRCRMIDLDQDGSAARGPWLKPLADERQMMLGVYADVIRPGVVCIGDAAASERS